MPNRLLTSMSGQPANDCPDHQKEGRPNAELAPVSAVKAVMRCGVDLGPNFTERGNFFGNSFHALMIPLQTLTRSPRFGGNEPFLGQLALGGSAERTHANGCDSETGEELCRPALAISERTQTDRKRLNCFDRAWMNKYYLA